MSACAFMHKVLQKPHQNHNTFSLKLGQGVHTYVRDNLQFLSCYCWIHSFLPLWDRFIWISRRFQRLNVAPDPGVELVTEMWACDQSIGNVQMFSGNPGTQLSSSGWVGTKLGCQEQLWPFSYCDGSLSTGDSPTTGWHLWCPGVHLLSVAAYLLLHLQSVTYTVPSAWNSLPELFPVLQSSASYSLLHEGFLKCSKFESVYWL